MEAQEGQPAAHPQNTLPAASGLALASPPGAGPASARSLAPDPQTEPPANHNPFVLARLRFGLLASLVNGLATPVPAGRLAPSVRSSTSSVRPNSTNDIKSRKKTD